LLEVYRAFTAVVKQKRPYSRPGGTGPALLADDHVRECQGESHGLHRMAPCGGENAQDVHVHLAALEQLAQDPLIRRHDPNA